MFCSKCGTQNHDNNFRCTGCGNVLQAAAPAPAPAPARPARSDKSRVAYILLGLFLGMLGIHNFYAGHGGRGVAQLLITLLTGWLIVPLVVVALWVLIELVATDTDGAGLPMS